VKISRAGISDSGNLATLAIQVWLDTYAVSGIRQTFSNYVWDELSPAKFEKKLVDKSIIIFKMEENSHLIGFAEIHFSSPCPASPEITTELNKIYIHQNYQGKKLGIELLEFIGRELKEANLQTYWLSVYENNVRAIKFYNKNQFEEIGELFFTLGDEKHRNIILKKKLMS